MLPTAAWKLTEIQVRDLGSENDNSQSNWKSSSGATMTGSHCTASSFLLSDNKPTKPKRSRSQGLLDFQELLQAMFPPSLGPLKDLD